MMETFTITEACGALGKSVANFRRWVVNGLVPQPVLRETTRHHYVYSKPELEIMAQILADHEKEYAYFCAKHQEVTNRMHQQIMGHRDIEYGKDMYERTDEDSEAEAGA